MGKRISPTLATVWAMIGAAALAGCRGDIPAASGGNDPAGPGPSLPGMSGAPGGMAPVPGGGPGAPPAGMATPTPGGMTPVTPTMPVPPAMMPPPMTPPVPPISSGEMPDEVQALLRGRCAGCHTYGQADPAGWGSVLDVSRMIDGDIIVPGQPGGLAHDRPGGGGGQHAPQGPAPDPGRGGPAEGLDHQPQRDASKPPSDNDILDALASDQLRLRGRSSDYRYVSFAHYAGQGRPESEMKAFGQVITFVINSLSRRGAIAELPTIDPDRSIFRIDLAELGWDAQLWDTLTSFYPYCLRRTWPRTRRCTISWEPRCRWCVATGCWPPPPSRRCTICCWTCPTRWISWPPGWASTSTTTSTIPGWKSRTTWSAWACANRGSTCTTGCWNAIWAPPGNTCGSPTTSIPARAARICWPTRWGPRQPRSTELRAHVPERGGRSHLHPAQRTAGLHAGRRSWSPGGGLQREGVA